MAAIIFLFSVFVLQMFNAIIYLRITVRFSLLFLLVFTSVFVYLFYFCLFFFLCFVFFFLFHIFEFKNLRTSHLSHMYVYIAIYSRILKLKMIFGRYSGAHKLIFFVISIKQNS